jgi:Spy/CpxP family protein refolding chaperone
MGVMKKKTIGIVVAAILSLGAIAAVGAEAAEHHGHGRHGRGGMFMGKDMQERLNLTADQKAKVEQMHQRQREQMKSQFAEGPQGAAGHQALMQEVFKDNPDQAVIQQRVAEMQQRQAAALNARVAAMQEFNSILTPAQRGEMQKLMAERSQKMQDWKAKRGERHQQKQQENQTTPKQP